MEFGQQNDCWRGLPKGSKSKVDGAIEVLIIIKTDSAHHEIKTFLMLVSSDSM